jgi:drug/metabolite transporter (DMT)-like permease
MRLPIFLVLLAASMLGTAVALRLGTTTTRESGVQFATALSGGLVGTWLLVTIAAFNVVSISNGSELTHSYPGLAVLGVLGTGVSILVLAKGSIELLDT